MKLASFAVVAVCGLTPAVVWAQHENHGEHAGHGLPATDVAEALVSPVASAERGPRGGSLSKVGLLRVETLLSPGGIRLYTYNRDGHPSDLSSARGIATLQINGDAKRYRYDLYPDAARDGSTSLVAPVDLSQIGGREVTLTYQIASVPGTDRRGVRLTAAATVPLSAAQETAAAVEKQAVCPVSGQALGSMGAPIPVVVSGETVYVCCQGCVAPVKAEPAKYLAMVSGRGGTVEPGSNQVRPGVYKVTAADKPFIAAQKNCPVMDEPLGGMGEPLKVHADGRAIYICCAGCAKKIVAEPAKYLKVLAQQGVTAPRLVSSESATVPGTGEEVRPGVFKASEVDLPFIAAQKLCPVMDEPLDGMGGPYRVVVEGRAVYICCPGCAKKLQANPQAYLQKLASQGIDPPAVR